MKDRCTAIVLAAGQGQRMKSKVKKQFLSIAGKPIVYYALQCFEKAAVQRLYDDAQRRVVEKHGIDLTL